MTKMAPPRKVYHSSQHIDYGGGVYSDTAKGTRSAARGDYPWIDKNFQWMPRTIADLEKPVDEKELVWTNAHGNPFNPSWMKGRWEETAWRKTKLRHPSLQNAVQCFKTCRRYGVRVEAEVKNLRPLASAANLRKMFARLAEVARQVFGRDWQEWVTIKILTNHAGGIKYAKKILEAAHEAGFKTMILARGVWRNKVINEPYITWNRGGRVK